MAEAGDPPKRQKERLRDGRIRSVSSRRWLTRQLNDPYVAKAKAAGYRSRSAFKLLEIDAEARLLKPGQRVVDLGAAPGGWSQVAAERVKSVTKQGRVIAIDLLPVDTIPGVDMLLGDFLDDAVLAELSARVGDKVDIVLSDMAPSASGQPDTDHLRIVNLAEAALAFALDFLKPGGAFLTKMLQGSDERAFMESMRRNFESVKRAKPPSSRPESSEFFLVARGRR